jgi:hypothetical protein
MSEPVGLVVTPRPATHEAPPCAPFECGHEGVAVWFKPVPFSAEWNYDLAPQWRCPVCRCCLGDAPYVRPT